MDPTETGDVLESVGGLDSSEGQRHQNAFEYVLVFLLCSVCSSQILTEACQGHEILGEDPAQVSILLLTPAHLKPGLQLHPAPLESTAKPNQSTTNPSQGLIFPEVQSHSEAGDKKTIIDSS